MLTDAENRELAGYLGICWHEVIPPGIGTLMYHCSCGDTFGMPMDAFHHRDAKNPDFSDPRVVLREMRKREDWPEFYHFLNQTMYPGTMLMPELDKAISDANLESVSVKYILDTTGLIARAALDFMRREKG